MLAPSMAAHWSHNNPECSHPCFTTTTLTWSSNKSTHVRTRSQKPRNAGISWNPSTMAMIIWLAASCQEQAIAHSHLKASTAIGLPRRPSLRPVGLITSISGRAKTSRISQIGETISTNAFQHTTRASAMAMRTILQVPVAISGSASPYLWPTDTKSTKRKRSSQLAWKKRKTKLWYTSKTSQNSLMKSLSQS